MFFDSAFVYRRYLYDRPPTKERSELTVNWLGTACVLLSDGETALLIDPFITRQTGIFSILTNRHVLQADQKNYERWIAPLKEPIKALFVTQSHFDHILDVGEIGKQTGATLIGSQSTAIAGQSLGLPKEQIKVITAGQKMKYGKFTITFLQGLHSGSGLPKGNIEKPFILPVGSYDLREGGTYVLYIEHPKGNMVCNNSANYVADLLKGLSADVIFLSIAQLPRELDTYLHETVDMVGASRVFPVHWDNFFQPLSQNPRTLPIGANLSKFVVRLQSLRPTVTTYTLPIGKPQVLYSEEKRMKF